MSIQKIFRSLFFILIICLGASTIFAGGPCEGTWKTKYGELRLLQKGKDVYGDYGNIGTIFGSYDASTKTLSGTFTNDARKGTFKFKVSGTKLEGKYTFGTKSPDKKWTGKIITRRVDRLKNYPWSGVWKTSFGELKLIQRGHTVYGNYKKVGKIRGTYYNAKTKTLKGTFDNKGEPEILSFQLSWIEVQATMCLRVSGPGEIKSLQKNGQELR